MNEKLTLTREWDKSLYSQPMNAVWGVLFPPYCVAVPCLTGKIPVHPASPIMNTGSKTGMSH